MQLDAFAQFPSIQRVVWCKVHGSRDDARKIESVELLSQLVPINPGSSDQFKGTGRTSADAHIRSFEETGAWIESHHVKS